MADRVAVVAHRKKALHGNGLDALREAPAAQGVTEPLWCIPAFDDAEPDDGKLEVGVTTAEGVLQWARTLGRMTLGQSENSKFVRITRGRKIKVELGRALPYELDGGERGELATFTAEVDPGALTVCVPAPS